MNNEAERKPLILVVEDVEETRDGIERLLIADGYSVDAARSEEDAVIRAELKPPNLILVSLGRPAVDVIAAASRIRNVARLRQGVPIVIFCLKRSPRVRRWRS
jgi:CheY-like chemotaxis protein